jgi:hypothetical protein
VTATFDLAIPSGTAVGCYINVGVSSRSGGRSYHSTTFPADNNQAGSRLVAVTVTGDVSVPLRGGGEVSAWCSNSGTIAAIALGGEITATRLSTKATAGDRRPAHQFVRFSKGSASSLRSKSPRLQLPAKPSR